jgi:hypothetical protein
MIHSLDSPNSAIGRLPVQPPPPGWSIISSSPYDPAQVIHVDQSADQSASVTLQRLGLLRLPVPRAIPGLLRLPIPGPRNVSVEDNAGL